MSCAVMRTIRARLQIRSSSWRGTRCASPVPGLINGFRHRDPHAGQLTKPSALTLALMPAVRNYTADYRHQRKATGVLGC